MVSPPAGLAVWGFPCVEAAALTYARRVTYLQLLFPDFSLIAIGYLLCRFTALNRPVWQAAESLVYFFLFPVLLFHSIVRSPLDVSSASSLMGAGLSVGVLAIALSFSLPHWPWVGRHIDARDHAAAAQVAFRFNSFIGLALAERLAGPQGIQQIAILIGVCVPLFNMGAVWPMARHGGHSVVRELARNPLIVATLSGLVANLLGFALPSWLEPTVSRIGAASLALGLMAAGAGMQLSALAQARTLSTLVLGIKHLLLPLAALLVARSFALAPLPATILLAFSALPTASTCYVLAARMGYNAGYVAGLVTLSTVLGAVSLSFSLGFLSRFLPPAQ